MNNRCPNCGEKLSVFYLKQTCPKCGVNLLYYKIDEQLAADAAQAAKEVEALWRFLRKLDKARLIEKHCKKKGKTLPWENNTESKKASETETSG